MELDEAVMNSTGAEIEDGDTVAEKAEEEEEEEETSATSSAFIQDLNLVLILAFLSLSADERLDVDEIKQTHDDYIDPKGKPSVSSTSHIRHRQFNIVRFRAPERQISKSHTKIQDCRHGRRV